METKELKQEIKRKLQKCLIDSGNFDADAIDKIMEVYSNITDGYLFERK